MSTTGAAKSLGIVQTHATQFDPGLFREITAQKDIDLTVYFSDPQKGVSQIDPELGRRSGWDSDSQGYRCVLRQPGRFGLWNLVRAVLSARHDLVIVSGYTRPESLLIAVLGRLLGRPIGIRSDSIFLYRTNENWKWKVKDHLLPLILRLFRTAHPTGSLARQYLQSYGKRDNALYYFPYSVNDRFLLDRDREYRPQRQHMRQQIGIGPDDFVMLCVVKFVDREDPLTFVRAAQILEQSDTPVRSILVGDGALRGQIESLIASSNLKSIHLTGYVQYTELVRFYAMSDVFVHPARIEQWGVSVNEAMVLGLPVVAADTVGSVPDLVGDNAAGLVYPVGDAQALAECVRTLMADPARRVEMSRQARMRVEEWSYRRTVRELRAAMHALEAP